ncbi:hypothetical protein [Sediminicola luteus]|uniref:Lipoprotein n=1 Tax=Sediminicola luteus TaxID=319238 RepID=A0ABV2TW53_9FLAO
MHRHYLIFALCLFLQFINVGCKTTRLSIEEIYDEDLAKGNPEYYEGLKVVLSEFQNHLIENGILENSENKSYIKLLKKIKKDNKKDFEISYDFNEALDSLKVQKKNEGLSMEARAKKFKHSKPKDLNRILPFYTIAETTNGRPSDSLIAKKFLKFYKQEDYDLPIVRVKLFKFLDPDPKGVIYIYLGRPTKE